MRRKYLVNGFVQGVGFRPFVKNLADRLMLFGFVRNSSNGVNIEVEGNKKSIEQFDNILKNELPYPAMIFDIEFEEVKDNGEKSFIILKSNVEETVRAYFPLDLAVCDDCIRELNNNKNRRFEYPFINCTACGPRYTIIDKLPYDRPNTTMDKFKMCESCQKEYENSDDRRYHAQPNACSKCGPKVELVYNSEKYSDLSAFSMVTQLLKSEQIVAIKGLGGYHLACDASSNAAVQKLRDIKNRDKKPLAIMVANIDVLKKICTINDFEKDLLCSKIAPILLLKSKAGMLCKAVAPNNKKLGAFLPYTPVHHLIFKHGSPEVLIMTSANDSSEPIISNDDEIKKRCEEKGIAVLTNNREINFRDDDSVIQLVDDKPQLIRGGRGYLPRPFPIISDSEFSGIAMGSDLKNSFSILISGKKPLAIISPFIGDLEHPRAQEVLEKTIDEYLRIFAVKPKFVAVDSHPKYFSSQIGRKLSKKYNAEIISIQHHHAHIASVMAEHKINTKVVGLALDGTGFGDDSIWGAECIVADYKEFKRFASIKPLTLVGGDMSIKEPWRIAVSSLIESENEDLAVTLFGKEKVEFIKMAKSSKVGIAMASSMGRLFDAVATFALFENNSNYEAELAIRLEQEYENMNSDETYSYDWKNDDILRIDFSKLIVEVALDKIKKVPAGEISYKFHQTISKAMVEMINSVHYDLPVVLSGGCFQNKVLFELVKNRLMNLKREVFVNNLLPVNDQCIALGQIAVASNSCEL